MEKVSDLVEVIGNPHDFVEAEAGFAMERLTHLTLAASTLKADFESFIHAEGQYMVQVTLVSHGFASPEEMERRVTTLDSGAKRNALKRSGFERPFQARQSRLGMAS
jgi:hypothetical protein